MHDFQEDMRAVAQVPAIPTIFEVIKLATGMGFSAVARVTEDRWVTCAVEDDIDFGLAPGGEIPIERTFCNRIRGNHTPVVFNDSRSDPDYVKDELAQSYDFRSYISVPIILPDRSFFGTLCGIDMEPRDVNNDKTIKMFQLFAQLIGHQLHVQKQLDETRTDLRDERDTAELREQFIAVLGHDLRSPLASISSGTQILLRKEQPDKTRRILQLIGASAQRMGGLVENLLDFARGRLGDGIALHKQNESLETIITQVVDEFRMVHPDREFKTEISVEDHFLCDHDRMAQLLSNLVGNAFKHGANDTPVHVRAVQKGENLELSVTNKGTPIPPQTRERLFQPFQRVENDQRTKGLGLGLYIASEITKAHGGTLDVHSDDKATIFTYRQGEKSS